VFPRGIEKVLNSEMTFQDFEKVLSVAKMYMKYCNSNFSQFFLQILFFATNDSFANVFALCFLDKILEK